MKNHVLEEDTTPKRTWIEATRYYLIEFDGEYIVCFFTSFSIY